MESRCLNKSHNVSVLFFSTLEPFFRPAELLPRPMGAPRAQLAGRGLIAAGRSPITAVAEGVITRSVDGEVAQALDPSGDERKGWSVFYMHVGTPGRAKLGMQIGMGEPIGHPSCEGGYSEGSHLHIARKYNGEWIDAGGNIPFVMSGWTTTAGEVEFDGTLTQGDISRTPCECRDVSINGVSH